MSEQALYIDESVCRSTNDRGARTATLHLSGTPASRAQEVAFGGKEHVIGGYRAHKQTEPMRACEKCMREE